MDTAKIFWTGESQAVRLPKKYRLQTTEVRVRRHGNAVILEPIPENWQWLDAVVGGVDADLQAATEEIVPPDENADLDFFK
jgi:antitoxin VapB